MSEKRKTKFGRRNTIIPSYTFPFYTTQNPPPESESESTSRHHKKKMKTPTLFGFPNPTGMKDPETKKKFYRRWLASMGPQWSPCPPTASESFLHEIPVSCKIAGYENEKVPAAKDDLAAQNQQHLQEAISSAIMHERECELIKNMKRLEYDEVDVHVMAKKLEVFDRDVRRYEAEFFRRSYMYGCNDTMEQKTCIWSSGSYTWMEKSSGFMWVAVRGMNSICLVTKNEAMDEARLGNDLMVSKNNAGHFFRETLISEMEDLADPSSEARQNIHQSFDKPFAVVSLISGGTDKANEKSSTEASKVVYDDKGAINFLKDKMKSSTLTYGYSQTLQTAVSAFLLLFDKELKAKDLKVMVVKTCLSVMLGII